MDRAGKTVTPSRIDERDDPRNIRLVSEGIQRKRHNLIILVVLFAGRPMSSAGSRRPACAFAAALPRSVTKSHRLMCFPQDRGPHRVHEVDLMSLDPDQ